MAAPTFPLTRWRSGLSDYVNQPGDVSFVIDELLADARQPGDPLYRHLDGDRVGVAGHSLGAATTIGVSYNSCCRDGRIDAAVEISGLELPFPDGDYADWPSTPLLAVHGGRDRTVPAAHSDALIAKATPPTYYLRFPQEDHTSLLGGREATLLDEAVTAFFDRYLAEDARPLGELPAQVRESGLATFASHTN